jgi:streptogramin lyase
MTPSGGLVGETSLTTNNSQPEYIAAGPPGDFGLWFTEYQNNMIARIDASTHVIHEFGPLTANSGPEGIVAGPDGNLWFAECLGNQIGMITPAGVIHEFGPLTGNCPAGITVGPDGNLWFAEFNAPGGIGMITTAGVITEFIAGVNAAGLTPGSAPLNIAAGSDGNLWFTELFGNRIGQITTAGTTTEFTIPTMGVFPWGIAAGPDGALWFAEDNGTNSTTSIGRIIPGVPNTISEFPTNTQFSASIGITVGPNNALWFTENNVKQIGTFQTALLTVAEPGGGSGSGTVTSTVPVNNPSDQINCGTTCTLTYMTGSPVTLTATASAGSTFAGWSNGQCNGSTAPCQVTLTGADIETAVFNQTMVPELLTVNKSGTGSGTVTSSPSGINCGAMCSASYQQGTQVTLTATPNGTSTFAGWGGACTGTGSCIVTMSAAQSVTANFSGISFTLSVSEAGTGTGQVTSKPAGINCSASSNHCSSSFGDGTLVTLTASASAGSSFTGWSGGCSGTGKCQVTIAADTNVTANFKLSPTTNMLSVVSSGTGSGTVTSTPSGINCGSTCSASFDTGTQIALSAAAANGSTFAGWSGGGCSGIDPCALTLTADTTVTASFVANSAGNLTLVAAVLPTSRSVEVGATATAFATMINAGPADGSTCTIAPATTIPAGFEFQTTDPTTNALTGTANTPANIAAGQSQSFVIALTPTTPFAPTDVAFTFTCANAASPAASTVGIDTLNLSASTTPVPDIVALAASGDPGYVDVPGATGTGDFAVATVNLGSDATITAAANTGVANLPVTLTVCQTNSSTGVCMAAPAAMVTTDIQPNATPTFGIFVTGSATVADNPGTNRVFVTFTDASGVLRGETSVAVRTQ